MRRWTITPAACEIVLIGGPFDGADGLGWIDDPFDADPGPPAQIVVARCVGGRCGMEGCDGRAHVAYWDALEALGLQQATQPYTRVSVTRWRAEYVHGSLQLRHLGHRELATAGMEV